MPRCSHASISLLCSTFSSTLFSWEATRSPSAESSPPVSSRLSTDCLLRSASRRVFTPTPTISAITCSFSGSRQSMLSVIPFFSMYSSAFLILRFVSRPKPVTAISSCCWSCACAWRTAVRRYILKVCPGFAFQKSNASRNALQKSTLLHASSPLPGACAVRKHSAQNVRNRSSLASCSFLRCSGGSCSSGEASMSAHVFTSFIAAQSSRCSFIQIS